MSSIRDNRRDQLICPSGLPGRQIDSTLPGQAFQIAGSVPTDYEMLRRGTRKIFLECFPLKGSTIFG